MGGRRGEVYENWSKTEVSHPQLYFQPSTTDEISKIIEQATSDGKTIRCIGAGASPSDICSTNDFMICMKDYNQVLKIDHGKQQIRVQSGITLEKLNEVLDVNGLAMPALPAVPFITIGGILGTGVHAAGKSTGVIASYVREVELMNGKGEIIKCNENVNKEIFFAALTHLGVLGIILNVTIQCQQSLLIKQTTKSMAFKEGLNDIEISEGTLYGKYFYYPFADRIVKFDIEKYEGDSSRIGERKTWHTVLWYLLRISHLIEFFFYICINIKQLLPWLDRFTHYLLFSQSNCMIDKNFKVLHFDCLFAQDVSEWAISSNDVVEFLKEFKELVMSNNLMIHGPIEIRFAKSNKIYLNQCYARDTVYFNILLFRPFGFEAPDKKLYWKLYEELAIKYNGRPHWAKTHPIKAEDFRKMYPKFDDFLSIRKSLDPRGIFINDYVRRHLLDASQ